MLPASGRFPEHLYLQQRGPAEISAAVGKDQSCNERRCTSPLRAEDRGLSLCPSPKQTGTAAISSCSSPNLQLEIQRHRRSPLRHPLLRDGRDTTNQMAPTFPKASINPQTSPLASSTSSHCISKWTSLFIRGYFKTTSSIIQGEIAPALLLPSRKPSDASIGAGAIRAWCGNKVAFDLQMGLLRQPRSLTQIQSRGSTSQGK